MKIIKQGVYLEGFQFIVSELFFIEIERCPGPIDHLGGIVQQPPLRRRILFLPLPRGLLIPSLLCKGTVLGNTHQKKYRNEEPNFHLNNFYCGWPDPRATTTSLHPKGRGLFQRAAQKSVFP